MMLFEFECRTQRFAVPLAYVRRVAPSAMPTPVPGSPSIVHGVLNFGGELVVVVDVLQRLGFPAAQISINQHLLILDTSHFAIGFLTDAVHGVTDQNSGQIADLHQQVATAPFVAGVLRLDNGLSVILEPEQFLFPDERGVLGNALRRIHDA